MLMARGDDRQTGLYRVSGGYMRDRPTSAKSVRSHEVTLKSLQPVIAIWRGTYFQQPTQLGRQLLLDDNFDIPKKLTDYRPHRSGQNPASSLTHCDVIEPMRLAKVAFPAMQARDRLL
jgi:hypothetical protein